MLWSRLAGTGRSGGQLAAPDFQVIQGGVDVSTEQ
jgi:hypothetical protein